MLSLYSLDVKLYHLINLSYHNFLLNNFALMITYLGVLFTGLIIAVLIMIFDKKRGKQIGLLLIVTLLVTFFFTHIIKYIILRPRPYALLDNVILLSQQADPSFPSGHTANATALAGILAKEYGHLKIFILIPVIVAISRIYIGVHYPSDVIGGFILGLIIAIIIEKIFHNKLKMNQI